MIKTLIDKLAIREFWMFTIAGVALLIVGGISLQLAIGGIPKNAEALLGTVVGGLILLIRDVINAIRALWRVSEERIEQGKI